MDTTALERSPMTTDAVPRMRASDAERTATIEALQDAMARGLLTHEEGDERMAATFVVRFRDELPPLTADLPQAEAAGRKAAATTSWRELVAALLTLIRGEIAATVAAGFRSRRFLVTALIALAVLAGLVLVIGHGFADGAPGHFAGRDGR